MVSVTVAKMPEQNLRRSRIWRALNEGGAALALTLAPANAVAGEGDRGVVVTNVNPNGLAGEHGIRTGDVILEVSGKSVNSASDVRQAIVTARSAGKHAVLMRIKSGNSTHFVAVPMATG